MTLCLNHWLFNLEASPLSPSHRGHCVNVEPGKVPAAARPTRCLGNGSQNLVSRRRRRDYRTAGGRKHPAAENRMTNTDS